MSGPLALMAGALSQEIADGAIRGLPFTEWVERWHEFYLMAGTAAVTLAGLLFVALSLHLDQLVEKNHEHLLALSRITLTSYMFVMIVSLFMLVPPMGPHLTGFMLSVLGAVGMLVNGLYMARTRHHEEAGFTRQQMRRRILVPSLGYLLMFLSGIGIAMHVPEMLYQMIGVVCMILGNAAGTSWELLVRVAQNKQAARRA